jgi:hypothetical protein
MHHIDNHHADLYHMVDEYVCTQLDPAYIHTNHHCMYHGYQMHEEQWSSGRFE